MKIQELIKYYESQVPKGSAWEKDNVGLMVGNLKTDITNIFLCLELTKEALTEAIKKNCNLIITHHPLIFYPISKIDTSSRLGELISVVIKNDITVYSSHTNLDFAKGGVSFELAEQLQLKQLKFLSLISKNQRKIAVFVPDNYIDTVAEAVFEEGGGILGDYEECGFKASGKGMFKGNENTNPKAGEKNKFQTVNEIKFEFVFNSWDTDKIIAAMLKVHPYEHPVYDIYSLENKNVNFGAGVIGTLENPLATEDFLKHITENLGISTVKYCNGKNKTIKTVAVCGGSGSDLLNAALSEGADAFITADVKYHTYHDATDNILLIDAGHYETEIFGLKAIKRHLSKFMDKRESEVEIYFYEGSTNPAKFYNNLGDKQID